MQKVILCECFTLHCAMYPLIIITRKLFNTLIEICQRLFTHTCCWRCCCIQYVLKPTMMPFTV